MFSFLALAGVQTPQLQISTRARSVQPGEIVLLTIAATEPAGAVHVRAFDRDWPAFVVDPRTFRVVIGIDLDVAPGDHDVRIRVDSGTGVARHTETLAVRPKTFPTRRLTVDPAFVHPPASMHSRIALEAAELARLWESSNAQPLWDGPFGRVVPHAANSAFDGLLRADRRRQRPAAERAS